MRSRPEAGSTDQDWGEKRAQNMVTVENDGAKQAVLRSVDEIFNARRNPLQSVICRRLGKLPLIGSDCFRYGYNLFSLLDYFAYVHSIPFSGGSIGGRWGRSPTYTVDYFLFIYTQLLYMPTLLGLLFIEHVML